VYAIGTGILIVQKNGTFSDTKIPAIVEERKLYDDNYFGKGAFLIQF